MRKSLLEKKYEENKLLLKCLKQENQGDMELTKIDYELIQSSLAVMRTFSMLPQNKRGRRMMLADHLENLIDLAMAKTRALGYCIAPVELKLADVVGIIFEYNFKYAKSKGKESNKRIHIDSFSCTEFEEKAAIETLKRRLKRLKENLIEIKQVKKKHAIYLLKNGERVNAENVVNVI